MFFNSVPPDVIRHNDVMLKIGVQLMKFASNHKKKYLHLEDEPKKTKRVTG